MNTLSRREEETLLKKTKESALRECDPIVKGERTPFPPSYSSDTLGLPEFAQCAEGRTFSVAWECRGKFKAVQDCMHQLSVACTCCRMESVMLTSLSFSAQGLRQWQLFAPNTCGYGTNSKRTPLLLHHDDICMVHFILAILHSRRL